jgi:hypothetical protein
VSWAKKFGKGSGRKIGRRKMGRGELGGGGKIKITSTIVVRMGEGPSQSDLTPQDLKSRISDWEAGAVSRPREERALGFGAASG